MYTQHPGQMQVSALLPMSTRPVGRKQNWQDNGAGAGLLSQFSSEFIDQQLIL